MHLSPSKKLSCNAPKTLGKLWDAETDEVKKIFKVSTSFCFEDSLSTDMLDIAFYQAKEPLREHSNYKHNPRKRSEIFSGSSYSQTSL